MFLKRPPPPGPVQWRCSHSVLRNVSQFSNTPLNVYHPFQWTCVKESLLHFLIISFLVSSYFYISLPPDQYHSTLQCEPDSWSTPAPQYLHERPDLWGWQLLQDQYQQQALAFISWWRGVAWFRRCPVWLCDPPCYSAGNGTQYVCHGHCGRKGGRSWTYHSLTLMGYQSDAQVSDQFNQRQSPFFVIRVIGSRSTSRYQIWLLATGISTDANKAKEKHWSLLL